VFLSSRERRKRRNYLIVGKKTTAGEKSSRRKKKALIIPILAKKKNREGGGMEGGRPSSGKGYLCGGKDVGKGSDDPPFLRDGENKTRKWVGDSWGGKKWKKETIIT